MRILRLSKYNLQQLEDELDRIGFEKYDIIPPNPFMPTLDELDDEDDEDEF